MSDNLIRIMMGLISTAVGMGVGWLMYAHPEGLNPSWPLWMAEFAPGAFVLAGVFLVVTGAGLTRLGTAVLRILLLCMLLIFNFTAFFTTPDQCTDTVSFLGVALLTRHPSPENCKISMELIVGTIDLVIVLVFIAFLRLKSQRARSEPPQAG
jgi:hypothetical protein